MEQLKEKTAMQQLKEWIDRELKLIGYEHQVILDKVTKLLEVEKKQIMDAYSDGIENGWWFDDRSQMVEDSEEEYFGKKYQ